MSTNRSDKLAKEYGGWIDFIFNGLYKIRRLFPQLGLLYKVDVTEIGIDELYPGDQSLLDFIRNNGQSQVDTIVL